MSPDIAIEDEFTEPEVVVIPAGSFRMGDMNRLESARNRDSLPAHTVTFDKPFAIGETEITFAQYDYFSRATQRQFPSDNDWGRGDRPVINVSWDDAKAYVEWLSEMTDKKYRLLSEAEWEYVARTVARRLTEKSAS